MKLSNKVYDRLKWICLLVFPALGVLITTLNALWNWGLPIEAIVGTLNGVATFIGAILGFSTNTYNKEKSYGYK